MWIVDIESSKHGVNQASQMLTHRSIYVEQASLMSVCAIEMEAEDTRRFGGEVALNTTSGMDHGA